MRRDDGVPLRPAWLLALGLVLPAWGQEAGSQAQEKLLARRAAEADCYRKLAETVYGLRITSDTYVRDFVAENDEIRSAVDTFVAGIRLGPPRYYEDGTCEVEAELRIEKLIKRLTKIHHASYRGRAVKTTDIENIRHSIKSEVIRVTGSGAPRADLPPGLPEGAEDRITPLPSAYAPRRSIPAIWKAIPAQGRLMAERAARLDATRKLLERIQGLRLTSDSLVRDFVLESDEISARAEGLVYGAAQVSKYLHDEELIAEVTMEVPVEKVITKIRELHTAHYRGLRVTRTDITNIKKRIQREMIRATGSGVPGARFLARAKEAGVEMPDWVTRRLRATGEGTDPRMDTAQGKLRAARAAELDAMRKLAERVYGLTINPGASVGDFVNEHEEIRSQVDALLAGAVADPPVYMEDSAAVTVSMPAGDVWSVIHQHMLILDRGS